MRLEIQLKAECELIQSALYYDQQVTDLGEHYEAEVRRATSVLINQLLNSCGIGSNLREFFLRRFLFKLIY
jgi:hypothetical protein